MKKLLFSFLLLMLFSCDKNEEPLVYTNNQQVFELKQSSPFPISGRVTFLERRDGFVEISIELNGTEGNIEHPAHLHYGDVSNLDAEVAAVLEPILGSTGQSITLLNKLSNENILTYQKLIEFDGHIKVHQDSGPNKKIILVAGNIGSAN